MQDLRAGGKTAGQATAHLRGTWPGIPLEDLRAALAAGGYARQEIEEAVGREVFYERLGPIGVGAEGNSASFDDLAEVLKLNEPLSRIDIHYGGASPGFIVGIQAYYGHGSAQRAQPLHGRADRVYPIDIRPNESVTGVSGVTYQPRPVSTGYGYIEQGTWIGALKLSAVHSLLGAIDVAGVMPREVV